MSDHPADKISEVHAVYGQPARHASHVERLISSGRLKAASVDLLDLGAPLDERHELSISEALREQRSES